MLFSFRRMLHRAGVSLYRAKTTSTILSTAHINAAQYKEMYAESVGPNASQFWGDCANETLDWMEPFSNVVNNISFGDNQFNVKWFEGGQMNVSVNCLDRHLTEHGNRVAIHWEPDDPSKPGQKMTYNELHEQVCKFGTALRDLGVTKGDRVAICMPMVPEAAVAMLACSRIGAIHSVIFGGFSPAGIAGRIEDAQCKAVITADFGVRGGRVSRMKDMMDEALDESATGVDTGCVEHVVVMQNQSADDHDNDPVQWTNGRDKWFHELTEAAGSSHCAPESMASDDPLFLLYTSGSTGKPKGVLHTSAGYLLHVSMSFKHVFDYRAGDVFWCTADLGWITGHSYVLYGPLSNGASIVMHEGTPNYPSPARIWEVCDKYNVTQCYTAPTAIRALMKEGDEFVKSTSRKSLRVLGTVGEPINPEAWLWYSDVVGEGRCPIIDTWWQTETGGIMMTPLPGATLTKPGSCCQPYFGIVPKLVDQSGKEIEGEGEGDLCIASTWPAMLRTLYKNHQRFVDAYFSADNAPGIYFTGDRARRDADGYIWLAGRGDDVLNVSGHRLGTAEIESALVAHPMVAEAAVVGVPHDIKGEGIYAYVSLLSETALEEAGLDTTLATTEAGAPELQKQLRASVRKHVGPVASPDTLHVTDALPKTVSGKIMRRILRKVAAGDTEDLGDTSTLIDPSVVDRLIKQRMD